MAPPQRKKNKRAPKRSRPPWGDLFEGKPIERWFRRDDPLHGEAAEKDAQAELDRRIARLADHLGAGTYRELVRAIVSQIDPAFTIIDPKPSRKPRKWWQLPEAKYFVEDVEDLRYAGGRKVPWKAIAEKYPGYGGLSEAALKMRHSRAVKYWTKIYSGAPNRNTRKSK